MRRLRYLLVVLLVVAGLLMPESLNLGGWEIGGIQEVQAASYSYTNNVNLNVPDGSSTTNTGCAYWPANRYFLVNDSFTVNDLNVEFSQSHATRGQIRLTLVAPDGTTRELISNSGDTNDNYYITLDDDGTGSINDGNADTIGGTRRSVDQNLLTDFEGINAKGHWTMTICDNTFNGGGITQPFNEARLVFDGTAVTPTPLNHQQGPAIQETYFLPWPEDQVRTAFNRTFDSNCSSYSSFLNNYDAAPREPMVGYTGVTIVDAGTIITYDHWEDGYETDLTYPSQNSTQVWGDGDLTNGAAPGDADDLLSNGQILVLNDVMLSTTLGTVIDFDARDKIGASKPINVSRSVWSDGSQTLFAAADEVYPVDRWGTQFYSPLGDNANLNNMFDISVVSIVAAFDGTLVDVDKDGNGTYETTGISLNEGDTYFIDDTGNGMYMGGAIRSNSGHPIQVNLMTADRCAGYESRTYPMLPFDQWDSSYYLPVSTIQTATGPGGDEAPTTVHVYNPNTTAITVYYEYDTGVAGSLTVTANSSAFVVVPEGNAVHFYSTSTTSIPAGNFRDNFSTAVYNRNDGTLNWASNWDESGDDDSATSGVIYINTTSDNLQFIVNASGDDSISRSADLSSFNSATLSFDIDGVSIDDTDDISIEVSSDGTNFTELERFNGDPGAVTRSYDITSYLSTQTTIRFIMRNTLESGESWLIDNVDISVTEPGTGPRPVFYAVASVDSETDGGTDGNENSTYDWGITMVPESEMSQWLIVGWAPGDDPTFDGTAENTAPIWLTGGHPTGSSTPDADFDICVDFNGDCTSGTCTLDPISGRYYDRKETISPITQIKIFSGVINPPDTATQGTAGEDQTGTSIWVCEAGSDALITAAWGEDPLVAQPSKPGVDLGYTVRNQRSWRAIKSAALQVDRNGNGLYDVGDTVRYTITVFNTGASVISTVNVKDTNDPNVTYVAESTYLINDGTTPPASGQISDNPSSGDFPLDSSGSGYDYTSFDPGTSFSIYYDVTINFVDPFVETRRNVAIITIEDEVVEPEVTINVRESFELGSIGNYVWLDEDGDGDQDAGEAGIPNVLVTITNGTETYTTYTDANGGYIFTDLPADSWTVTVTPPTGLHETYDEDGIGTPNVSVVDLSVGEEHLTTDFGYNWSSPTDTNDPPDTGALGTIGDRVWVDVDGEGDQDPEEVGLQGVTVELWYDSNNDGVIDAFYGSDTTDANGNYLFDDLPAGIYEVRVINPPSGWAQTGDPDAVADDQTLVVLGPGDVFVNADFGYQPSSASDYGEIGDTVWFDANADGVYDSEAPAEYGLAGVTVSLIQDVNGNGIWDVGEPIIATDITDKWGEYLFTGLPATGEQDYLVWVNDTEDVLDGLVPTYDDDGIVTPNISSVSSLTSAGDYDQDFGYTAIDQDTGDGLIGDTVFLDANNNGSFDAGEGMEGVLVKLYASDGVTLLDETTTNEDGLYYFGDLAVDETYIVQVQTGTLPYPGLTNTVDPDGGNNSYSTVTLTTAVPIDLDQDFGYRDTTNPNTISGTIWEDTNADGTLDTPDEPGRFEGVTVVLKDGDGNIIAKTVTDVNGDYSFDNLPDGTYTVDVTDDDNILNGYWHSDGPNDGVDNNSQDDPYTVSVSGGETNTTADFGYYIEPASVGNYIYYDVDGDGIQDTGEPGIPGVEVVLTITYPNGTVTTVTTTSDENGFYSFENLLLDEDYNGDGTYGDGGTEPQYEITVATPTGYMVSPSNQGGDDAIDSDDGIAGEQTQPEMGADDPTNDFGFFKSDLGDAPDGYQTTIASDGPGNILYPDTDGDQYSLPDTLNGDPAIWLGLLVDTETDGQPTSTANGDDANGGTLTDEDGVDLVSPSTWFEGTDGGTISVDLNSSEATTNSGYLMAWFDWNNDGAFDPSEMVVGEAVNWTGNTDTQQFTFDIPTGGLSSDVVYRVRLFDSEPDVLGTAMTGLSVNGEVEDYYAPVESLPVTMNYFLASRQGNTLVIDWSTGSEMGNLGFNLYYQTDAGMQKLNADLIPATGVSTHVPQDYHVEIKNFDWAAEGEFFLQDVDFFGRMKSHGPFALGEVNGERTQAEATDWEAIAAEDETLQLEREAENLSMINSQLDAWQNQIDVVEDVPNIQEDLNRETYPYQYFLPLFIGGEGVEPPPQDAVEVGDLLVDQTGIYRVTYEDLLAAGLDLGGQQASDIALISGGSAVPIRVGGGSTFGAGSTIEFYGEGLNTLYTTTNVYTLWIDPDKAQRISEDDTPYNDGLTPASYYMETERVDLNQVYEPIAAWSDPWFNEQMIVTSTTKGWDFPLLVDHYIAGAAPAELSVTNYAGSDFRNDLPDHHYLLDFNGYSVADQLLDGAGIDIVESTLEAGQVVEGENTLTVTLVADTGQEGDIVYLDVYSLSYPRAFWARDGILSFSSSASAFQVDNLLDSAIEVYRLENGTITRVNDLMVMDQGGSFSVRFNGSGTAADYVVVSGTGLMTPEIQPARVDADITTGSAEYLVISHPNFIDGLAPLVSARSAQGLAVKVVNVFDVYDQFSYGLFDPGAIQAYIEFAWQNLGTQYVLLVGDDTYDYHNYEGNGVFSFIPSLYAPAGDFVQYTPVDPKYVDFDGDNIPDLPIGRFAVRTAGEVDNMVSKTLSYDTKSYLKTSVFTADTQYSDESDALIYRLPGDWAFTRAYLDFIGASEANQHLIDQINAGVSLTSYVGHSDDWEWTWDGLFDINDWAALTNIGQPTLMTQNGCWNVYYLQSDYETLSDMMLNKGLTGAAAMFGSTTLTSDFNEQRFGAYFFPLLTQPGMTIGDAMTLAKAMLAAEDINTSDVLIGWTLLGDPYLMVVP